MPHPDPTAAAAWSRVLARLDGTDEPDAPTTAAEPTTPAGEALPGWFAAIAAVPTTTTALETTAPTATTAPPPPAPASAEPVEEGFVAWLDRRRAERAARGG